MSDECCQSLSCCWNLALSYIARPLVHTIQYYLLLQQWLTRIFLNMAVNWVGKFLEIWDGSWWGQGSGREGDPQGTILYSPPSRATCQMCLFVQAHGKWTQTTHRPGQMAHLIVALVYLLEANSPSSQLIKTMAVASTCHFSVFGVPLFFIPHVKRIWWLDKKA